MEAVANTQLVCPQYFVVYFVLNERQYAYTFTIEI
jgi:hypothetical protein